MQPLEWKWGAVVQTSSVPGVKITGYVFLN